MSSSSLSGAAPASINHHHHILHHHHHYISNPAPPPASSSKPYQHHMVPSSTSSSTSSSSSSSSGCCSVSVNKTRHHQNIIKSATVVSSSATTSVVNGAYSSHHHTSMSSPPTNAQQIRVIKTINHTINNPNSPKTLLDSIIRCQTTKLDRFVLNSPSSLSPNSKLERNFSYIEAMKDTPGDKKQHLSSLPSSNSPSTSSSSSTIEPVQVTLAADPTDLTNTTISSDVEIPIEIPIDIKLNTTSNSTNLAKSRSQSSLINLFKTTFSPFQIRKWRSKSRDKLFGPSATNGYKSSSSSQPKSAVNATFCNSSCSSTASTSSTSSSSSSSSSSFVAQPLKSSNLVTTIKNPMAANQTLPIHRHPSGSSRIGASQSIQSGGQKPRSHHLNGEEMTMALFGTSKPSIPSNSGAPIKSSPPPMPASSVARHAQTTILSPPSTSPNQPTSERQLSYLKLTCLLNGYDDPTSTTVTSVNGSTGVTSTTRTIRLNSTNMRPQKPITFASPVASSNVAAHQSNTEFLKSSKTMLSTDERYYDIKLKYLKQNQIELKNNLDSINHSTFVSQPSARIEVGAPLRKRQSPTVDAVTTTCPINGNGNSGVSLSLVIGPSEETREAIKTPQALPPPSPPPITSTPDYKNQEIVSKPEAASEEAGRQVESTVATCANGEESQQEKSSSNHDGHYYLQLHDQSCDEIRTLCHEYEKYVDDTDEQNHVQNEEVLGQIQAAIGKGHLLINQKLKQFKGLCDKNIREKEDTSNLKEGEFLTRDEDLAGFWDLVSIQVDDIRNMFTKLDTLRKNGWKIESSTVTRASKPVVKKSTTSSMAVNGLKQTAASKARAEAAKQRLIEAKKNAMAAKQKELVETLTQN